MIKRSLLLPLLLPATAAQAQDKAAAQPDMAKAKQTAEQVWGACHGADGNSQISANRKLAGQHSEYVLKQLRKFKSVDGKPALRGPCPTAPAARSPPTATRRTPRGRGW